MARTIESPGVEINEIDLSNISQLTVGTNIFIQGFAATGPTHELLNITSVSEFERIYGYPTNAAERYAYTSVRQVLQSPGNVIFNRLPYGSDAGEGTGNDYTALVYPYTVIPNVSATFSAGNTAYNVNLVNEQTYQGVVVGAPNLVTLPLSAFEALQNGDIGTVTGSSWLTTYNSASGIVANDQTTLQNGAFIVTNNNKSNVEKTFAGYYIAATDNTELTDTTYEKIKSIQTRNNGGDYTLPSSSISFNLTSEGSVFSTSEIIETSLGFNFEQESYNDMVQFTLMRLRPDFLQSTGGATKTVLSQTLVSTIPGSLDVTRVGTELTPYNPQPGTMFLDNTVDRYGQDYISVKTNPVLAGNFAGKIVRMAGDGLTNVSDLSAIYGFSLSGLNATQIQTIASSVSGLNATNELVALGEYEPCTDSQYKIIGNSIAKLDRGFKLADNKDLVPLDIVIDAGISTIEAVSNYIDNSRSGSEHLNGQDIFDDTIFVSLSALKNPNQSVATGDPSYKRWQEVFNSINTFCKETRKDCMFIMDPLRNIFVQGKDTKVLAAQTSSFSQDILVPLRNLINQTNSNYGAVYGNWVKNYDSTTDSFYWVPFSGFQAAIMARVDANLQPWIAPSGFNNGVIRNIVDVAISPNQKERDLLYRYSINPIANFPGDGFVVMGQKTLQAKPSALDRINVRRLFLVLEKATRQVAKYFVFEPNTVFTRTRLVNVLTPIFENAKNNQGVYDYLIVCDERNNTPDVIDRNELTVDIYLKPVRAAEFILINFIATRTGDDFSELIGV